MKNILNKITKYIFSCEEYSKTHNQITFCGIKLKLLKQQYLNARKNTPFHNYKKNNIDITNLPKATGILRDLQLANLAILKEFDLFCSKNNLSYFLFAGSALGQVRHNGFIPWDDDIDIAMPRDDYNRVIEEFNNNLLYAELFKSKDNSASIIKIRSKESDKFFIDIFSFDFTGKKYTKKEQLTYTKEIKKARKKFKTTHNDAITNTLQIKNKYVADNIVAENNDILLGTEWDHSESNWFLKYDTVYPIKEAIFEGMTFKSMANPKQYLADYYGNYMSYPKKLPKGHSMYDEFTTQDCMVMDSLKGLV